MSKTKYPKKYRGQEAIIKKPVLTEEGMWVPHYVLANGKLRKSNDIEHKTETSCWTCCDAFNNRLGYNSFDTNNVLNSFKDGEKGKKAKKEEKSKSKGKKSKSKSKSKGSKKT